MTDYIQSGVNRQDIPELDRYGLMNKVGKVENRMDELEMRVFSQSMEIDMLKEKRNDRRILSAVVGAVVAIAAIFIFVLASVSPANAQSRDTTSAELLKTYSSSTEGQNAVTMYTAGVIEGMWAARVICPPEGKRRDVLADVVILTLARTEGLYGVSISAAVPRVAAMVYPCGDPA